MDTVISNCNQPDCRSKFIRTNIDSKPDRPDVAEDAGASSATNYTIATNSLGSTDQTNAAGPIAAAAPVCRLYRPGSTLTTGSTDATRHQLPTTASKRSIKVFELCCSHTTFHKPTSSLNKY